MPRVYSTKNIVDDNGRECTYCGRYKERKLYYNCAKGTRGKKGHCIDCEADYKNKNREKSRSVGRLHYKKRKVLPIGSEIIIEKQGNIDQYKVLEYKKWKGYLIESKFTGYKRRQSLWRNGQKGYIKVHKI